MLLDSKILFCQTDSSNNLFAPKPFGGTSTAGVFGAAQTPSPFGASSSPAFSSSMPEFASSSTPSFGTSSTLFGGSTGFGQKPAFIGFGSTPTQPAFRSSIFGSSTPFGASSQPAFGSAETPAFGATSTPAFGATSTPAFSASSTPAFTFGPTHAFGQSSSAFGSTGPFGSTTSAFGGSQTPTSAFGNTGIGQSWFGGQRGGSRVASYSTTTEANGGTSGQTAKLDSILAMPFYMANGDASGLRLYSWVEEKGSQTPTPAFGNTCIGQSGFVGQRGGSRVGSYLETIEADGGTSGQTAKLESISAMPVYKDKSHEELRWEDYQLGDKGSRLIFGPASENDRQQRNNSKGIIPQENPFLITSPKRKKNPAFWHKNVPTAATAAEDLELAMAINESIQYALQKRPTFPDAQPNSGTSSSISGVNTGTQGSSCVMCLDAPAEGACVPCGHVAGCMSCLNVVKTKKRRCPICRAKIDQIIKLYHV